MNTAQAALLARLREVVAETPPSGAGGADAKPYHPTRFAQAIERRAEDGDALVKYMRTKLRARATGGYDALIEAGREDLTVEAIVADADAPWSGAFDDDDRRAASERLGTLVEAERAKRAATEADGVDKDRRIVALMNERRAGDAKAPLSPSQEADVLARLAAKRAADA